MSSTTHLESVIRKHNAQANQRVNEESGSKALYSISETSAEEIINQGGNSSANKWSMKLEINNSQGIMAISVGSNLEDIFAFANIKSGKITDIQINPYFDTKKHPIIEGDQNLKKIFDEALGVDNTISQLKQGQVVIGTKEFINSLNKEKPKAATSEVSLDEQIKDIAKGMGSIRVAKENSPDFKPNVPGTSNDRSR